MRKIMLVTVAIGAFFFIALFIDSCVHEIPAPIVKEPTGNKPGNGEPIPTLKCSSYTVYFEQQVLPLVASLCGKSGCHGSINPREFRLIYTSKDQSYQAIRSTFPTNTSLVHALNEMADQGVSEYLPPTSEQLAVLQKWIAQGTLNNSCNSCDTTQYKYAANVAPLIKYFVPDVIQQADR